MARAVAVRLQRAGEVALRDLHVADSVVRHREIALPAGVAGIGVRQARADREAVAIRFERLAGVTLFGLHVADFIVRHREIALPAGVAGIGFRQTIGNREAVAVRLERAGEVALRDLHVADVFRTDAGSRCQPALPGSDFARRSMIANLARYEVSAPARLPCAICTSPILSLLMPRSYCQPALPGSDFARRSIIANFDGTVGGQRPARSPCATCTLPILSLLIPRSYCHSALPGSDFARRSLIARPSRYDFERTGEVALVNLRIADCIVRHREIAIIAASGGGLARGVKGLRRPASEPRVVHRSPSSIHTQQLPGSRLAASANFAHAAS